MTIVSATVLPRRLGDDLIDNEEGLSLAVQNASS